MPGHDEEIRDFALAQPAAPPGIEATRMLLGRGQQALFETALHGPDAAKAIAALGNSADARAVPLLLPLATDAERAFDQRRQTVRSLAQSPAGVAALLKLAEGGKFPEDLRASATQALAAVQLPKLKEQIATLFPAPNALGGTKLPTYAELAKMPGDAAHGKELFAQQATSCVTCHRIGELGVDFAPALSEIGTKLGKEALYEAIIDPNAGIAMGFETTMLTLKDGNAAVGIVRSETADGLALAMPQGLVVKYAKGEIATRAKLPTSMMPSGLNQALTEQDLVDLVTYLSGLKAPGK